MIIFWNFMVSNQLLNSDSNYKFMKSMIEGMIEARPDTIFVVSLPISSRIRYQDDGFFRKHSNNIIALISRRPDSKMKDAMTHDNNLFYEMTEEYGPTIIINNIPEVSHALSFNNFHGCNPKVVTYNHYTIHPTLPYPMIAYKSKRIAAIMGNYCSDYIVFNTKYHLSMHKDNMREFHLDAWEKEMDEKTTIVPIPVLDSEMKKHYSDDDFKLEDKIKFFYNHRLQNYKHFDETFDMFQKLWDEGNRNFEVILSYASGDNIKSVVSQYPFIKISPTHLHEDYYKKLKEPHFNTLNTTHETFCISIVESALLGGIPIVPRRVTFPEIFPTDYPFFFDTKKEQENIIRAIITKKFSDEYLNKIKKQLRAHFQRYESKKIGEEMFNVFEKDYKEYTKNLLSALKDKEALFDTARKYKGKWIELKHLCEEYRKRANLNNQAMPTYKFVYLMENIEHETRIIKNRIEVRIR